MNRYRYPKPKPLSFVELQARVTALEGADRGDTDVTSKANRLLHERFSNELAQRKMAQARRMGAAIRQSGYKG